MKDIHHVIDRRAVHTVFQPLVDLNAGGVLGYEALTRGPAHSPWEAPAELFAAARAAGREAELDWVCRAQAFRRILAAGADAKLTWFVNMRPGAARADCPPDLADVFDQTSDALRVVTELPERAIAEDPAGLLATIARIRSGGSGVALDDVGADASSLALLPFLHPDLVKLDMQRLGAPDHPDTARVVAAVAAHAEATGAIVLAEGIETARHLETARTMGATVGQGWHFGRPGSLPRGRRAQARLPFVAAPRPSDRTPFEIVSRVRPVARTSKERLMSLSRHLEALAGTGPEPPVLLTCFQDARHFGAETAARYARIASHSPLVAAIGAGLPDVPAPGVRGASLADDDPLRGEWNVFVVGPHQAVALVAHDLGDRGSEGEREFDFALTHDRALVLAAAGSMARWLVPSTGTGPVLDRRGRSVVLS